jgi:ParB/RepB/Spo0J family partition protein
MSTNTDDVSTAHKRVKVKAKENSKVKKAEPKPKIKLKAKALKSTKAQPPGGRDANHVVQIAIKDIVILSNRRKIDREAVFAIAASMEKLGQFEPIIVRKETRGVLKPSTTLVLVEGGHRIEAAKSLGRKTISAVYFEGDEDAARVFELTQSLARANNTVLDRAKFLTELVRRVLGESRAKELAQPGGRQPGDKGISKTARALGYPRDDIRRSRVIASMSEKAMAKAEELELDDNESALLKIAKKKPNEQVAVAEQLGAKKKGVKKGSKKPKFNKKDEKSYATLADAWADATEFEEAFREATENARRKFISLLQRISSRLEKGEDAVGEVKHADEQDEQDAED